MQQRIEIALESLNYPKPTVARINGSDVYFAPDVYKKLQADSNAMSYVLVAIGTAPGVAAVYRAEELRDRPATQSPTLRAFANSYFPGRSGDLFILPKPYWLLDSTPAGKPRTYGTGHGVPYNYDQHVPVLLMGFGIQPGQYFQPTNLRRPLRHHPLFPRRPPPRRSPEETCRATHIVSARPSKILVGAVPNHKPLTRLSAFSNVLL